MKDEKKKVIAVSRAQYRGVALYELPGGVGIFLGVLFLPFLRLQDATNYIDTWYELKKN